MNNQLHTQIQNGNKTAVKTLLKKGANPNATSNQNGNPITALETSLDPTKPQWEIAETLIRAGAKITLKTIQRLARMEKQLKTTGARKLNKLLAKNKTALNQLLTTAAQYGNTKLTEETLKLGANPHWNNNAPMLVTALHKHEIGNTIRKLLLAHSRQKENGLEETALLVHFPEAANFTALGARPESYNHYTGDQWTESQDPKQNQPATLKEIQDKTCSWRTARLALGAAIAAGNRKQIQAILKTPIGKLFQTKWARYTWGWAIGEGLAAGQNQISCELLQQNPAPDPIGRLLIKAITTGNQKGATMVLATLNKTQELQNELAKCIFTAANAEQSTLVEKLLRFCDAKITPEPSLTDTGRNCLDKTIKKMRAGKKPQKAKSEAMDILLDTNAAQNIDFKTRCGWSITQTVLLNHRPLIKKAFSSKELHPQGYINSAIEGNNMWAFKLACRLGKYTKNGKQPELHYLLNRGADSIIEYCIQQGWINDTTLQKNQGTTNAQVLETLNKHCKRWNPATIEMLLHQSIHLNKSDLFKKMWVPWMKTHPRPDQKANTLRIAINGGHTEITRFICETLPSTPTQTQFTLQIPFINQNLAECLRIATAAGMQSHDLRNLALKKMEMAETDPHYKGGYAYTIYEQPAMAPMGKTHQKKHREYDTNTIIDILAENDLKKLAETNLNKQAIQKLEEQIQTINKLQPTKAQAHLNKLQLSTSADILTVYRGICQTHPALSQQWIQTIPVPENQ